MPKMHFTREPYLGRSACSWDKHQNWQVTEDISKVNCRHCLNSVTPAADRYPSTEELQKRAAKFV